MLSMSSVIIDRDETPSLLFLLRRDAPDHSVRTEQVLQTLLAALRRGRRGTSSTD